MVKPEEDYQYEHENSTREIIAEKPSFYVL